MALTSLRLRDFRCFASLSCALSPEETLFVGENAQGKTSLLEVVEGLAPATSGKVRELGRDPHSERRAVRPRIGIVLQDSGFPPELTVAEMVRMWAGTLTASRPVGEALDLVNLSHRAGVGVLQLSGGERRRLDLARCHSSTSAQSSPSPTHHRGRRPPRTG